MLVVRDKELNSLVLQGQRVVALLSSLRLCVRVPAPYSKSVFLTSISVKRQKTQSCQGSNTRPLGYSSRAHLTITPKKYILKILDINNIYYIPLFGGPIIGPKNGGPSCLPCGPMPRAGPEHHFLSLFGGTLELHESILSVLD